MNNNCRMFIIPLHFTFLENPAEKKLLILSHFHFIFLSSLAAGFQIMEALSLALLHTLQTVFSFKQQ